MTDFTATPQWKQGQEAASFLDIFWGYRGWQIEPTTPHEERVLCLGDRHFRRNGEHYFVEYKNGRQTAATGNVFLETVSVDTQGKPGWVYTCQADYIFYAALLNRQILIFKPDVLRSKIEILKHQFREASTRHGQNKGYNTHGVLVPLSFAQHEIASKIVWLDDQ